MDKQSKLILKIYSTRRYLDISQLSAIMNQYSGDLYEIVAFLRKKEFLRIDPNYASLNHLSNDAPVSVQVPLEITFKGKAALEEEQKLSREERNEWVRYWITTVIALAAFIKSFLF